MVLDANDLQKIRRIEHCRRRVDFGRKVQPLIRWLRREGKRRHIELRFPDL